jgi:hypothetical protein
MTKKELAEIEYRMNLVEKNYDWNSGFAWKVHGDVMSLVKEVKRLREVLYGEFDNEIVNHI